MQRAVLEGTAARWWGELEGEEEEEEEEEEQRERGVQSRAVGGFTRRLRLLHISADTTSVAVLIVRTTH